MTTQDVYNQAGGADKAKPAMPAPTSPEASAATGTEGKESLGNEPITREYLDKFGEEILTKAVRQAQSLTDKMGNTLDQRIKEAHSKADEAIKLAETGGITMTDQQKQQIRQSAVNEAISQPVEAPAKPKAETAPPDFVDAEVRRLMADSGIYVSPEEAAALIGTGLSPFVYVEKFKQLIEAKQRNPSVRLGTLAPSGNAVNDMTALKGEYDAEIALINSGKHPSIRRGQTAQVVALKNEYRKRGLLSIY